MERIVKTKRLESMILHYKNGKSHENNVHMVTVYFSTYLNNNKLLTNKYYLYVLLTVL